MDKFDNPWIRFALLIVCGAIGIALYRYLWDPLSCLLKINGPKENYIYIHSILLGLPVFFCLWWFRTRDVRQQIHDAGQQIDKTETQIQQNSLFNGIANLSDKDPLKIDIGVAQLLALSKLNSEHDESIRIAFIRRLKKCPLTKDEIEQNTERLAYAQHIFEWITDKKVEADLTNCHLDCQDFTKEDVFYNIVKNPFFREAIITCTQVGLKLPESDAKKIWNLYEDDGLFKDFWINVLHAGNVNGEDINKHNLTDTSEG
ncbi:hypothetical protein [Candidatus Spongiihabitans sp.]|uniref:hypothetical protein n=1 Tax=Candidatus Spongiihabitans sp. TaxID=3101308 RepID=UPI003C7CC8A8